MARQQTSAVPSKKDICLTCTLTASLVSIHHGSLALPSPTMLVISATVHCGHICLSAWVTLLLFLPAWACPTCVNVIVVQCTDSVLHAILLLRPAPLLCWKQPQHQSCTGTCYLITDLLCQLFVNHWCVGFDSVDVLHVCCR